MLVMHGRAPNRMMARAAQRAQGNSWIRRTRSSHARLWNRTPSRPCADANRLKLAHTPLAWSHGRRRIALQQFNVIEALCHAIREILRGHVVAQADESSLIR